MKNKPIYLLPIVFLFSLSLSAQEKQKDRWDLTHCIEYAIQNNSSIQKQRLDIDISSNNYESSKLSKLPSVSSDINNTTSWGRTLSNDNTYINKNSNSTTFNVNARVKLFQGGALKNQIRRSKYDHDYQGDILKVKESNLSLQVTEAYLNILVAKEMVNLAKEQIEITEKQITITKIKVEEGLIDKGPLLELKTQLANNETEKINAQNNLELRQLELAQLLELENPSVLNIQIPKLALLNSEMQLNEVTNYYTTALDLRPEIQAAKTMIKRGEVNTKAAKGELYPTISAGANYSNGYYYYKGEKNTGFSDQMQANGRENVSLGVSIPIFNGKRAKNAYKNAKIQEQKSKIDLIQAEKDLRKTITNALTQAKGAHQKYTAASTQVKMSKESFYFADQKFNAGAMNIYDYNQAKNSFIRAKSQKIQSKYEFIFRTKMLDFYVGKELKL